MDEYAFLIELNSNLGFKFAGNAIVGDIENLSFKISFAMNNSLKVHTKAYLDSSYPTEEHVVKALEKTGSFPKHDLEYENIDLFVPPGANVEKTDKYYRDFIIMFSVLGFVYIFIVLNFLFAKFTVVDLVRVMAS